MSGQQSSNGKGNPAHKRASNPVNKASRARSYAAGVKRKGIRALHEGSAAQHNREILTEAAAWHPGITPGPKPMTPWQAAKEK